MFEQQHFHLHGHHNQLTVKMNNTVKRREMKKPKEEEKLQAMDLSGMSLDSLPKSSLHLALVSKLDLSNNNLKVCIHNYTFFRTCFGCRGFEAVNIYLCEY